MKKHLIIYLKKQKNMIMFIIKNYTENIIDFRDFIIKLVNKVKNIDNIEERTSILYNKYFLKIMLVGM